MSPQGQKLEVTAGELEQSKADVQLPMAQFCLQASLCVLGTAHFSLDLFSPSSEACTSLPKEKGNPGQKDPRPPCPPFQSLTIAESSSTFFNAISSSLTHSSVGTRGTEGKGKKWLFSAMMNNPLQLL